ncbi:MAG: M28 family peptidase [Coriobacteriia bacterium]|nr:M28 family peptidase [Coriobacteriia bacterium]
MAELIEHVRALASEIGPRPATSDGERRAAEWIERSFAARGLATELQSFDSIRTYSWAYVLYNLATLAAAFVAGWWPQFAWPAFAVSAIVAFFLWTDLDTRWGLTRLMPKRPSQNVIARHVPRARRGEKFKRIVIVAHYDSAKSSLAFSPGLVGNFATTMGLMKIATFLTPVFVLALALPWTRAYEPWVWYATLAVAAYLIVPVVINIHREIAMPFVAGANDNASGVAAMIGVMERLVPEADATSLSTSQFGAVRRDARAAYDEDVVPSGAELRYTPAGPPAEETAALPDDFTWAEPVAAAPRGQSVLDFDTIDFVAVADNPAAARATTGPSEGWAADTGGHAALPVDVLPADVAGPAVDEIVPARRERKPLFGGLGRKKKGADAAPREWLGVDEDFDARKAGKNIGSWDNFDEDADDDGFGWKGGWAGDDPIGDPDFAASEAARIRRRVTESIDRELTEKEVWFVATGAEEVGTLGMQAFLRDYGEELRDSLIINIDGCGAGVLHWVSAEGMARRYRANARLVGLARRVSRETDTLIKPRLYKGMSTDATPALARGYKAISIMAFDPNGMPANWHWKTDTVDALDPELIEKTAEFVTAMVREA